MGTLAQAVMQVLELAEFTEGALVYWIDESHDLPILQFEFMADDVVNEIAVCTSRELALEAVEQLKPLYQMVERDPSVRTN